MEKKFVKVDRPDSPDRCQGVNIFGGQCSFKAAPDSPFCVRHANNKIKLAKERQSKRMYALAKWKTRAFDFAEHEDVKSLREEIGILRLTLEEVLNQCNDSVDLLMYSSKISSLVNDIKNLVVACHKIEESTGVLLDKTIVFQLATSIVTIISDYIEDPDVIDVIGSSITELIEHATPLDQSLGTL